MYTAFYEKITDALVKNGFIIIENAFEEYFYKQLLAYAKGDSYFKKAGISFGDDMHIDSSRRRDKIHWLNHDNDIQSEFLDFTNGLQDYLNKELYLGLNYYEAHFAIYENGAFYEKHLDCFLNFKNRIVTTVYYLNENWQEGDGGELVIYDINNNFISKVAPKSNTFIVFLSENFPHEVLKANAKRYSIAGWFRVDKPY